MISWHCNGCGHRLNCEPEYSGKRAKCGHCREIQFVPKMSQVSLLPESIALPHIPSRPQNAQLAVITQQPKVKLSELEEATVNSQATELSPDERVNETCIWCNSQAIQRVPISGWQFLFCGNDDCISEASKLINQHIFEFMWHESSAQDLPEIPQVKSILSCIERFGTHDPS